MPRRLLGLALALGLTTACAGPAPTPADGRSPNTASAPATGGATLYHGGEILTMAGDAPAYVEAVVVKDGRIAFAGGKADAATQAGPDATQVDLAGRTMLPGFVDAHGHVSAAGLQAMAANLLPPPDGSNDSIAALQATTRVWLASADVPRRFGVIVGFGYDDSQLREQRHPTRDELDAISSDLPIYFIHQSGHLGAANSKALELAGVTAASVDPQGGVIGRRAGSREPDGVLEETAHYAVLYKVVMAKFAGDAALELIQAGQQLYTRFGFTTAQDGATDPATVQAFQQPDSMRVPSATVNRTTRSGKVLAPEQRVDPYVALMAMTTWAAYQHFEEASKGTLEAGKLADFVILSGNPVRVDRATLASLPVVETVKEGASVYRAPVVAR